MELLRKLNRILDRSTKLKLILWLFAAIISGLIETATVALISPFVAIMLDNSIIDTNPYINWVYTFFGFQSTTAFLAFLSFAIATVYVFRGVYQFVYNRIKIEFFGRRHRVMSERLLHKILGFSYLYHTHKNVAEMRQIIQSDVQALFGIIGGVLDLLNDFLMSAFMIAILLYENPLMTACVLGLALLCVFVYFIAYRKKIQEIGAINRRVSVSTSKVLLSVFGGIKEVKVARREKYFEKAFKKYNRISMGTAIKYKLISMLPKSSMDIVCYGGALTMLGFFILSGADVAGLVPQLSLFVMAAFRILPAINSQVGTVTSIMNTIISVDSVHNSLFEEKDMAAQPHTDNSQFTINQPRKRDYIHQLAIRDDTEGITVTNVSFSYPSTGEMVLEDIALVIPENSSVALVGPSGAGKTTLADIVLGVLTPDKGVVCYKGIPIHADYASWSSKIGYIPQHIYLLDESVLENVTFGIDKKAIDEEKAWKALEQAQLKSFVESMPNGIHTVIGDRGIRLSGGQRQRIGIARAMYDDPPILVLDEATSSLDTETEAAVMEAIIGFHGNKTILIVAHRLTTIEHCDTVYRVEDKKVRCER